jgi:hypothetical protein
VVLVDVNADAVEAAAEGIRRAGGEARAIPTDIRSYEAVEQAAARTVERYGRIDILANIAGGNPHRVCNCPGGFEQMTLEAIDWGIEVRCGRRGVGGRLRRGQKRNDRTDQVPRTGGRAAWCPRLLCLAGTGDDARRDGGDQNSPGSRRRTGGRDETHSVPKLRRRQDDQREQPSH